MPSGDGTPRVYSTSADTANGSLDSSILKTEIVADPTITKTISRIATVGNALSVYFTEALPTTPTDEQAACDAVVLAHAGPVAKTRLIASTEILGAEVEITQDQTWQNLGGVTTNIAALMAIAGFDVVMANSFGRATLQVRTSGTGTELRVVEVTDAGAETPLAASAYVPGDTSDAWETHKVLSDVTPASGDRVYCLQGRLNGATTAFARFGSFTLLEIK